MTFLDDWKTQQTSVPRKEIQFFRFFAELLKRHHPGVHYYEVHGNPGQVEFKSGLWPTKPPVQRELGDLIIVTYSYQSMEARYTVQQNKFEKTAGAQRDWPTFKFKADIHQYDLLAFRPVVKAVGSIPFPPTILSHSHHDSVASYGVFYEGTGHLIDFAYCAARWLSPQSYSNKCNLIVNAVHRQIQRQLPGNEHEVICTIGIEEFLAHLLLMNIGAPIKDPQIGGFLNGLIQTAAASQGEDPPVIDIPVLNQLKSTAFDGGGGFRLLLIRTDEMANSTLRPQ